MAVRSAKMAKAGAKQVFFRLKTVLSLVDDYRASREPGTWIIIQAGDPIRHNDSNPVPRRQTTRHCLLDVALSQAAPDSVAKGRETQYEPM